MKSHHSGSVRKFIVKNQHGSVLLLSIVFSALLAVAGLVSFKSSSKDTVVSSLHKKNIQSFYLAEAGIEQAKGILKTLSLHDICQLRDATNGQLIANTALGTGSYAVELSGDFDPGYEYDQENLDLTTTLAEDVIVEVVCSHYAESWGEILEVYAAYKISTNSYWRWLFDGDYINGEGGQKDTIPNVGANVDVDFRFIEYDYYCDRDTRNPYEQSLFLILKDSDTVGSPLPFASQPAMKEVLYNKGLLAEDSTHVKIENNQVLLIMDIDIGDDYQDAILLISFGDPNQTTITQDITLRSTGVLTNGICSTIESKVRKSGYNSVETVSWREVNE